MTSFSLQYTALNSQDDRTKVQWLTFASQFYVFLSHIDFMYVARCQCERIVYQTMVTPELHMGK